MYSLRYVLLNQNCDMHVSLSSWTLWSCLRFLKSDTAFFCCSMQQGKMFFFIGITMAVIQGGYARRIKPGHQIQTVRMVNSFMHYWITSQFKFSCNFLGTLMINYSKACTLWLHGPICFHVCAFQAIISLVPAFLLIGIAWNLTLLYSGLFLYSFGKQLCINSVSIKMYYLFIYVVFFALVFQFVIINVLM